MDTWFLQAEGFEKKYAYCKSDQAWQGGLAGYVSLHCINAGVPQLAAEYELLSGAVTSPVDGHMRSRSTLHPLCLYYTSDFASNETESLTRARLYAVPRVPKLVETTLSFDIPYTGPVQTALHSCVVME